MSAASPQPNRRETIDWFHSLAPVAPNEMTGLWKGFGIPSGHPLDGVLENLGWFGKRFRSEMRADALLFYGDIDKLVAVDPVYFPIRLAMRFARVGRTASARNLFTHIRPRVRARGTTASLEQRMDEGVTTAAMIYDRQPITDFFRQTADGTLIGKMVVDGDPRRFFFGLERADRVDVA